MTNTSNNSVILNSLQEKITIKKHCFFSPLLNLGLKELDTAMGPANFESDQLNEVFNSKFDKNSIPSDAYTCNLNKTQDGINLKIELSKTLPFRRPYYLHETPLKFQSHQLCSFAPDNKEINLIAYNNENDFIIEILPKDEEQQIIIIKKELEANTSFLDLFNSIPSDNIIISPKDKIAIPLINVDIKSEYEEIKNRQIQLNLNPINLDSISENLNFILNNKGAVVESLLVIRGTMNCAFNEPKNILINDSFVIFLKQKSSDQPYFAGYISDTEFLTKFDIQTIEDENSKICY